MKVFNKAVFIFITLVSFLCAQSGKTLKVQLENNDTKAKPQVLKAQLQVTAGTSDGVFITLPAGLTVVVQSATLDGNPLWLINSENKIEKNNVMGWYYNDTGIVLHYNSEFGGQLDVELAPDSAKLSKFDQIELDLHQVKRTNDKLDVENTVTARSNLLIKKNTQTDEE